MLSVCYGSERILILLKFKIQIQNDLDLDIWHLSARMDKMDLVFQSSVSDIIVGLPFVEGEIPLEWTNS